jgi:hypothetical protein
MKRLIYGGLLCASCVAAGSAYADGYDDTGAFYVSGMADWTFLDKRRISRDDIGEQIGIISQAGPPKAVWVDYSDWGLRTAPSACSCAPR